MDGRGAGSGVRGVRGQDTARLLRGRADPGAGAGGSRLRVPAHDGVQRVQSRLWVRHVRGQGAGQEGRRRTQQLRDQKESNDRYVGFERGGFFESINLRFS